MSAWEWVKVIGILGPIGVMLVVGLIVAVQSGVGRTATANGSRRMIENLSRTALVIAGSLVGLAVVHQLVGLRLPAIW
jgi:hypothetical protein